MIKLTVNVIRYSRAYRIVKSLLERVRGVKWSRNFFERIIKLWPMVSWLCDKYNAKKKEKKVFEIQGQGLG